MSTSSAHIGSSPALSGKFESTSNAGHRVHVDLADAIRGLDESSERLLLTEADLVGRTGLGGRRAR
jgi:hypothetical protein